jgi:hypothetical protein
MIKINVKNTLGFTLVETLIYLAIIGIVVTSFVSFGISVVEARNKNFAVQEVQSNAREALSFMVEKIRNCQNIVTPAENEDGDILTLEMPDGAEQMMFYPENGILYAAIGSSQPRSMTSGQVHVSNLKFMRLGRSVKINFTIKFAEGGSRDFSFTEDVETAAALRR